MKILIVGGSGLLGTSLKSHLEKKGHSVEIIGREGCRDVNGFVETMGRSDFVFFLAFKAGGAVYLKERQFGYDFISENVAIMSNVFHALKCTGVPFIYTSTQMATMNHSAYGTMKRLAEFYTQSLGGLFVRFWNVYGLEKHKEKFHALCDFCYMAKYNKLIRMKTNGKESRQFLHVDDCCKALITVLDNYNQFAGKPLDITNFEWVTMIEVARTVSRLAGDVQVVSSTDTDWVQKDAKVQPNPFLLDYWKPEISLEKGLAQILIEI